MTQPLLQPEQLAREWADRIAQRLAEVNIPPVEVEELRLVIFAFTRTAAEELTREGVVILPYTDQQLPVDPTITHEVIDLFLRGVNYVAKKLHESGKPWEERKTMMENMALKLFNLAKLLVGFLHIPNPAMQNMVNGPKDAQLMMKQTADMMLQEELGDSVTGLPHQLPG